MDKMTESRVVDAQAQGGGEVCIYDWQVASLRYGLGKHADLSGVDDDQLRLVLRAAGISLPSGGEAVQRVAAFVVEYQRRVAAQTRGGLHHDTIYTLGTNDAPLELRVSDLAAMLAAQPPSAPVGVEGSLDRLRQHRSQRLWKADLVGGQISVERMRAILHVALAQQPVAVDGAMAIRVLDEWHLAMGWSTVNKHWTQKQADAMRAALSAALAAQPGGSDNACGA